MDRPRLAGGSPVTSTAVDGDRAAADILQPRDQPQQRGLAATRRTDEDDELAVADVEVHILDDGWPAKCLETFLRLMRPMMFSYFTAPNVRPRTSWRCENQPITRIGAMASVDAADSLAQNSPSGLE